MDYSLRRHINIHLRNPGNNYILSENCKHCKLDRRISYAQNLKKPRNIPRNQLLPIRFNTIHRLLDYNIPTNMPSYQPTINYEDTESDSDSTVYGFPDYIESQNTSLQTVNNNSSISIYVRGDKKPQKCIICYDFIKSFQVTRTLVCEHYFHQKCIDTWLEKRKPVLLVDLNC